MKLRHLLFLLPLVFGAVSSATAQKQAAIADSLWCDHLNEILKCASIDVITERIAKGVEDSTFIPALKPALRLSASAHESIKKEYGKVSYECYLHSDSILGKSLTDEYVWWYKKTKTCLYMWEEARLKNGDPALEVPDDYFFTNSEDETSVRLDIVADRGYHVRLRIF